jgi:hypothetical protein
MDDEAGRLVHDEQMLVFEEHVEIDAVGLQRQARRVSGLRQRNAHHIARSNAAGGARDLPIVHRDGAFFNPPLQPGSGGAIEVGKMPAQHLIETSSMVAPIGGECTDEHEAEAGCPAATCT